MDFIFIKMLCLNASKEINEYIESLNINHKFLKDYQYLIYQYFLSKYFKNKQLLLLWLSVGKGKTLLSISCGIAGLQSKMFDKIIILSPKSIQDEFKKNLKLYCKLLYPSDESNMKKEYKNYKEFFYLVAYNSWKSYENLMNIKKLENSLFIIDEAHLFMKSIIKVQLLPNESISNTKNTEATPTREFPQKGKEYVGNAKKIYDKIKSLKSKKILALTGTPSAKTPFETIPMFNLAYKHNLFSENYIEFNEKYIDKNTGTIKHKEDLIKKLDGLIAYVPNINNNSVKVSNLNIVYIEMSELQYKQYIIDYEKELNESGFSNKKNIYGILFGAISSFHAKTFEDCIYYNSNLKNKDKEDRYKGKIIIDSIHTPKIIRMYNDSQKINGTCVFYFRFTRMYGIGAMEECLNMKGYKKLKLNEDPFISPSKRYVIFSGDINMRTRNKWKDYFNDKRNMYGKYIKYLLLSPSGSVGITLKNVRYLGIGSVSFNFSEVKQILGRVNRLNSHEDLPQKDKTLSNNIYIMRKNMRYFRDNEKYIKMISSRTAPGSSEICPTIEEIIYRDSIEDDKINEDFKNNVLIKASITETVFKKFH